MLITLYYTLYDSTRPRKGEGTEWVSVSRQEIELKPGRGHGGCSSRLLKVALRRGERREARGDGRRVQGLWQ